jgi:hypothetical protein
VRGLREKDPFVGMCFGRPLRILGRTMEKERIALATKLLVKAQGTNFDAEAAALTSRAYRLLAAELNAYDDRAASAGVARKRERRQLRDRRATSGSPAPSAPHRRTEPALAGNRCGNWIDPSPGGRIDLRM